MATLEVAGCALEGLLQDLGSVAQEAAQELGPGQYKLPGTQPDSTTSKTPLVDDFLVILWGFKL